MQDSIRSGRADFRYEPLSRAINPRKMLAIRPQMGGWRPRLRPRKARGKTRTLLKIARDQAPANDFRSLKTLSENIARAQCLSNLSPLVPPSRAASRSTRTVIHRSPVRLAGA